MMGGFVGQKHQGRDLYRQGRNNQREGTCLWHVKGWTVARNTFEANDEFVD